MFAGDDTVIFASVIVLEAATPLGSLRNFRVSTLATPIRDACTAAGVNWAVFAVDISANEHATGRYDQFLLPHVHGIVVTADKERLREELKRRARPTDAIPRPVKIQDWDGDARAFNYLLKVQLGRRVGVDNAERINGRTGKIRLCRAVRNDRPRSAERREMLLFLDRLGIHGRIILINASLARTDVGIRIVPVIASR